MLLKCHQNTSSTVRNLTTHQVLNSKQLLLRSRKVRNLVTSNMTYSSNRRMSSITTNTTSTTTNSKCKILLNTIYKIKDHQLRHNETEF